jgi:hypothetical protein
MLEGSLGEPFNVLLAGYATRFRRAAAAGGLLGVPRLTEVLADPAFAPLDDWLREHAADVDGVQTAIDFYLEQARRIGTGQGLADPNGETRFD